MNNFGSIFVDIPEKNNRMKTIKTLTLYCIPILLLFACKGGREPLKPSPSGAPGDLLLVVNEKYWEGFSGDTLRSILAAPVNALPQNEPLFDVIQIGHGAFDKNFKSQRNIIVVKVGADQEESKIVVQRGLWARTQLLIGIQAPDEEELINLLNTNRDDIVSLILNTERKRLMHAYRANLDPTISKKLREQYNIEMTVPVGFKMDVEEENFIWLSQEYRDIVQGIFIYTYPYTEENTFTAEYLTKQRDRFTRQYVPGEVEGSYMTTETLFPPVFREYKLRNERYTAELRGLWRMEGGIAMGGPYISITQLDEERNLIVTADAFVFAPAHNKRDLLRQLEAIILTMDIVGESENTDNEEGTDS